MKKTFCYLIFSISTVCLTGCRPEQAAKKDYAQYVNTFIGGAANGHTFPGACVPFGLVQTSPVTGAIGWGYCSEYMNADSVVWGFTQTHLNGTGCMDLGDILIMPITGNRIRSWDAYRSTFSKSNEHAVPGYYAVELDKPKVKAELTATTHVTLHRYTFHQADSASVLIDLQHGPAWNENIYHSQVDLCHTQWEDAQTLTGHVKNTVWVEQDYFFVLKFDRPVTNHLLLPRATEKEKGQRIIASFDLKAEEALLMKIGLSTISIAGAKKNMETELADWDFDTVRQTAYDTWNGYLSRVDVTGTKEEKINYYTSLYHDPTERNLRRRWLLSQFR